MRGPPSTWVPQWRSPLVTGYPGDGVPQFLGTHEDGVPWGWDPSAWGTLGDWGVLGCHGNTMPQFLGTHGGGTPQSQDVLAMGPQRVTGMKVGAAAMTGPGAMVRGTQRPPCLGHGLGTGVIGLGSPHELGAAHPPPLAGRGSGAVALGGSGPLAGSYLPNGHGAAAEEGAQSTPRVGAPPTPWHCHPCPCHPPALPPPGHRARPRC